MKLIVGLGNPGVEYTKTRHNIGFMVLDNFLGNVNWKEKFNGLFYNTTIDNEQVIFVKPLTYMNLSGICVKQFVNFYKINIDDILIIQDDLDIEINKYRIKKNSSSGGHNGIKSIIEELGTDEFTRLKVGILNNKNIPSDKYVLGKFNTEEIKKLVDNFEVFNNIISTFIKSNAEEIMLKFNKRQ